MKEGTSYHPTNPIKVIRKYCLDCCRENAAEVKACPSEKTCDLWPFRMGKNPYRTKRVLSDEQKEVMRDRLAAVRMNKGE